MSSAAIGHAPVNLSNFKFGIYFTEFEGSTRWFSIRPAMLNTKKGKELVAVIPKTKILTETDGPFAKFRGNSLMPWDVNHTCPEISKIW